MTEKLQERWNHIASGPERAVRKQEMPRRESMLGRQFREQITAFCALNGDGPEFSPVVTTQNLPDSPATETAVAVVQKDGPGGHRADISETSGQSVLCDASGRGNLWRRDSRDRS
jgi:hypothetical protein